jgi:YfiH family protein
MRAVEFDSRMAAANDCRPFVIAEKSTMQRLEVVNANWSAPDSVRALTTTRLDGASAGPFQGLNLGDHVGDDSAAVAANRAFMARNLRLPAEPLWLAQVHGSAVVDAGVAGQGVQADAAWTDRAGVVCAVLTADCIPLALATRCGTRVAAVHVGWRGLVAGVVENTLAALGSGRELVAWMGPAISRRGFEVGPEVVEVLSGDDEEARSCFRPGAGDRSMADLFGLLRLRLNRAGVVDVAGGEYCTFSDPERFYSHRRDGLSGRMATLVWRAAEKD